MKLTILDRYILTVLLKTSLLSLLVLVLIFVFFSIIDQLEEVGRGRYGVWQALEYVVLTSPHLMAELFPIATVIGSMATLGTFASSSELAIIRTSGVSKNSLIFSLCKGGLVLVVIAFIIGELVAPSTEQIAQHRRSVAMTEQITLKTKYGFWSRDGNNFINIRKILPGNQVEKIYIYEFDDDNRLRNSTFAKRAEYIDGRWILKDIQQTEIGENEVKSRTMPLADWESLLSPEVINLVIVKPQYLSIWGLIDYIDYLKQNEQNSQIYEQALWFKVAKPFTIMLMLILAVPIVKTHSRQTNVGQRVFVGCLIGIGFYIFNQICGYLGLVYNLHPALSMFIPLFLLFTITVLLINKRTIAGKLKTHSA